MEKQPRSVGVHNGAFHADEVTACALLILFDLVDRDKIVRTREPEALARCEYVCDVGGVYDPDQKLFDHHQADYQGKWSSAGMMLAYLKEQGFLSPQEYDFLNDSLVIGIDDHDNGRAPVLCGHCSFSHVIANFVPPEHDAAPEVFDAAFGTALEFVIDQLLRKRKRYQYLCSCRELVAKTMERDRECLFFDKSISWLEGFFDLGGKDHPALFVIMPSGEHWKLRGVPPSFEDRMSVRQPLPEEWAGLLEADLKRVSGIPGAIFCHKGRFISVWESKEDAMKALEFILQTARSENN